VSLAAALGADHCELIKDVPGYFTADPARDHTARHLPDVDIDTAIAMADAGCELVQAGALLSARDHGVRLVITTTRAGDPRSIVESGDHHAFRHQNHPCRAAVGA
jgi:aspartate kinase